MGYGGSQYVSVTALRSRAEHYAVNGDNPSGFVAVIDVQGAFMGGSLIVPDYDSFHRSNATAAASDGELLILGGIPFSAILDIYKAPAPNGFPYYKER